MATNQTLSVGTPAAPRHPSWPGLLRRLLAVGVGAIFIYAGTVKVSEPIRFASDISNYQLVPWTLGVRLAFYLPWLEIACGLALVSQRLFSGALCLTTALIVLFTGATLWARAQNINVACGCFGTASSNLSLSWHLVLNGCILASLVLLWATRRRVSQSVLAAAA